MFVKIIILRFNFLSDATNRGINCINKKMKILANVLTAFVALLHFGILVLEMFFWNHPVGQKIFNMTPEVAASSATLAANQGLYNGFLAIGLVWGLFSQRRDVKLFFLGCIVAAGIFGGLTAKTSILLTQALPAFVAFVGVFFADKQQEQVRWR